MITGAVGVGKTTVAFEISEILEARGMAHALVDADVIYRFPAPANDPGGRDLGLRVLGKVWEELRQTRPERLILARVVESNEHLAAIRRVLPGVNLRVVRLSAPLAVTEQRIRQREAGSGREWHLKRAADLIRTWDTYAIEGDVVETAGRPVTEVASDVLHLSRWLEV